MCVVRVWGERDTGYGFVPPLVSLSLYISGRLVLGLLLLGGDERERV
jgi:hypothetical protein